MKMAVINSNPYALSPAAESLGLGSVLQDQAKDETEEQRRRRLVLEQMRLSSAGGLGTPLMSGRGA